MPCQFPGCPFVTNNNWCIHHKMYSSETKIVSKFKPIAAKSDKRKEEDKEYRKMLAEMRAESDLCELKVEGVCTGKMEGAHHLKKRSPSTLLDRRFLKRSCNACNLFVETHSHEAKVLGLVITKY